MYVRDKDSIKTHLDPVFEQARGAINPGVINPSQFKGSWRTTDDSAWTQMLNEIATVSEDVTIEISKDYSLTSDHTIPQYAGGGSTHPVNVVMSGGAVTVPSGKTLTVNGSLDMTAGGQITGSGSLAINGTFPDPGSQQVFGSGLTVTFAEGVMSELFADNWGTTEAALNAALASGCSRIKLSERTVDFVGTITVPAGVELVGQGDTSILNYNTTTMPTMLNVGAGCRLSNFKITSDAIAVGESSGVGINALANATDVEIDRVTIVGDTNAKFHAININVVGCKRWHIHDCDISGTVYGILFNDTIDTGEDFRIERNRITEIRADNIELNFPTYGARNVWVKDNYLTSYTDVPRTDHNAGFPIGVANVNNITITGNHCPKPLHEAIHVEDASGHVVIDQNDVVAPGLATVSNRYYNAGILVYQTNASKLTVTADHTTDTFTITAGTSKLATGDACKLSAATTIPTGLVAEREYYVIVVDATHLQLARTRREAAQSVAIDFTSNGVGTLTLYEMTEDFRITNNSVVSARGAQPLDTLPTFTAIAADDSLLLSAPHPFQTGDVIEELTTTDTLPDPLVVSTAYYVIRVSDHVIKLATTTANATAGTAINLTDAGVGTHSIKTGWGNIGIWAALDTWQSCQNVQIKDNFVQGFALGIHGGRSHGGNISGNNLKDCSTGIFLSGQRPAIGEVGANNFYGCGYAYGSQTSSLQIQRAVMENTDRLWRFANSGNTGSVKSWRKVLEQVTTAAGGSYHDLIRLPGMADGILRLTVYRSGAGYATVEYSLRFDPDASAISLLHTGGTINPMTTFTDYFANLYGINALPQGFVFNTTDHAAYRLSSVSTGITGVVAEVVAGADGQANSGDTIVVDKRLVYERLNRNEYGFSWGTAIRLSAETETFTASDDGSGNLLLTFADPVDIVQGQRFRAFSDAADLPANMTVNTDYYAILVSATTIKLATTLWNAQAGTAVAYSDAGTGTHTALWSNDLEISITGLTTTAWVEAEFEGNWVEVY